MGRTVCKANLGALIASYFRFKVLNQNVTTSKLITLFALLIKDSDCECGFIDGTHIKVHQHSNGSHERVQAGSKSVADYAMVRSI